MREFVRRYDLDPSTPPWAQVRADLVRRLLLPAGALWAVVVGVGGLIEGPLDDLPAEDAINATLVDGRTPTMDAVTSVWSNIGATFFIVAACVVAIVVLWRRTRQWWFAVVPGIAVSVQSSVFVTAALVVGRTRPEVEPLDVSPPTSSFPSGHVGASTAFYVTMALLAQRVRHPILRRGLAALCLVIPVLVAYARLYRGMHHVTDVAMGFVNGLFCAVLAWRYLRRDTGSRADAEEV